MRLLYDTYTTRRKAEILLLAGDFLTVIAAVLFATGIWSGVGRELDAVLIVVWAVIPRALANFLAWLDRPRDFFRSFLLSSLLVTVVTVLTFCGWELIWESGPRHPTSRIETSLLVILAWASGFLLCLPRAYRLSDFLLTSTILLGILEQKPWPLPWLALFGLGVCLSTTSRHVLHNVFPDVKRPRINLQNVRALSIVGLGLTISIFALATWVLRPHLDEQASPGPLRWDQGPSPRPPAPVGTVQDADDFFDRRPSADDPASEAAPDTEPEANTPDAARRRQRMIGYSQRLALSDLAQPRYDPRVVMKARVVDAKYRPVWPTPSGWTPSLFLWKGISFSTFDAKTCAWLEETSYRKASWNASRVLKLRDPPSGKPPLWIEVEVVAPVFSNLVAPYFVTSFGPLAPFGDQSHYLTNSFGDIFPREPGIQRELKYMVRFDPWPVALNRLPGGRSGQHGDRRYLQLPASSETGIDLERLVRDQQLEGTSIRETVEALQLYFARDFRYSAEAFWTGSALRLRDFIFKDKVGDCAYFATATALILRAAGVSTRVAVGFLGAQVNPRTGEAIVRNATAHSWVEVFVPPAMWYPVDPTTWVEAARSDRDDIAMAGDATGDEDPDAGDGRGARFSGGGAQRSRFFPGWEGRRPRRRSEDPYADGGPIDPETGDPFESEEDAPPGFGEDASWVSVWLPGDTVFGEDGVAELERIRAERERLAKESEMAANRKPEPRPEQQDARRPLDERVRAGILRGALLGLAGIATVLLLVSYLKPRKKDEKEEDAEEDERDIDLLAIGPVGLPGFQPTTPGEEILHAYHTMQRELVKTRNHRLPHQTPREHGRRFRRHHDDLDDAFDNLTRAVYRALYAKRAATDDDVRAVHASCRLVRKHLG